MRSAEYVALAQDVIDFADALGLERFLLVGHDWGAAVADMLGALFPKRLRGMVTMVVGYWGAKSPYQELPMKQIQAYWYQWYFQTEKARKTLTEGRDEFCRHLWKVWAPGWKFSEATLKHTARSFHNPDFVDIVLHSYRHRWRNAKGDPRYASLHRRLAKETKIRTPTIMLHGKDDGALLVESSAKQEKHFAKSYERKVLPGVGHFVPREKPQAVIDAVLRLTRSTRD